MLKIAIANANKYLKLSGAPVVGKFVAIRLQSLPELDEESLSRHMTMMRVTDCVYKTTCGGRFADLDRITIELLDKNMEHVAHDAAVSSGVTSLDLYDALEEAGIRADFHVSDKYSEFTVSGKAIRVVRDMDGKFIEGYAFSILADPRLSWKAAASKLLGSLLEKIPKSKNAETFYIYDRRLQSLIKSGEVKHLRYDLLAGGLKERFSFVRCMNALNRGNFSDDEIRAALRGLADSLVDGGVLLVGRTEIESGENRATFFRKENGALKTIHETNGGCEVKDLVMISETP